MVVNGFDLSTIKMVVAPLILDRRDCGRCAVMPVIYRVGREKVSMMRIELMKRSFSVGYLVRYRLAFTTARREVLAEAALTR